MCQQGTDTVVHKGREPRSTVHERNSHKGLRLGKIPENVQRVQELELRVRVSTGYYLYTATVNLVPKVRTLLVMYSNRI